MAADTPSWIYQKILGFFNYARNVDMILDGTIQDDPADGPGNTMGPTLAARILRERNKLPQRRFTEWSQLDAVKGVGEGTIQDLIFSLGTPADQAFKDGMYSQVISPINWPLEYFRTTIEDQAAFQEIVQQEELFRHWLIQQMQARCTEGGISSADCTYMTEQLGSAYIDTYNNTIPAPGYALALWFYEFDADNWFSWETIQAQTLAYFNHHMNSYPWEMELRFFRGFRQKGIIPSGITPPDLPVVVNWPEQCITFWVSTLYD